MRTTCYEWCRMFDVFIPSYKRADRLRTVKYFVEVLRWPPEQLHVVIDSEADDKAKYEDVCARMGARLHVFDMDEARRRYDYVHRPSPSRRSAGQARNMIYGIAVSLGTSFFMMMDDDTRGFQIKYAGAYVARASRDDVRLCFARIRDFMARRRIGLFGLPQTGDFIGGAASRSSKHLLRWKVMNTTFVDARFIQRGERGVQDDDTSQFAGVLNAGLFCGTAMQGVVLEQVQSATQPGGLTDLYQEAQLLNKAMVVPIQFPSAVYANQQKKNGGRIHHTIERKHLAPCLLRVPGATGNIAWDTYPEDVPFTNEPKQRSN